MTRIPSVIIIGGGFSGLMTAAQLLRRAKTPVLVQLIERRRALGRGVAYGTSSPSHRLNVPAGKMSAFPEDPGHFVRWLERSPGHFARRKDYARYLAGTLKDAVRAAKPGVRLELLCGEAVAARPERGGALVCLSDGRALRAERVVLAMGHLPPAHPTRREDPFYLSPRYIRDPWAPGALESVQNREPILLVGTGLTMVDQALALTEQGHRGPLFAVSRRGLLPQPHAAGAPRAPLSTERLPQTPLALLRELRRRAGASGEWRSVVDSLRPKTPVIWRGLPGRERRRFLRHLRPFWDSHRHRVAPRIGRLLDSLIQNGRLKTLAGRIKGYQESARGVAVEISPRGGGSSRSLRVARVINCTGPDTDYRRAEHPLLAGLRDQGILVPHESGLGASVKDTGALIGKDGTASRVFFTLGPSRAGELWESVAVPELREQAAALAQELLRPPRRGHGASSRAA